MGRGLHGETQYKLSTHTVLRLEAKQNPLALAGHVEGRGLENNAREAAPVPEVRAVQNLSGAAEHRTDAGVAVRGPYFVSWGGW